MGSVGASRSDQPWKPSVCRQAVECGHIAILDWLWKKCPAGFWDRACSYAFDAHQWDTLHWLLSREPPLPWEPIGKPSKEKVDAAKCCHQWLPSQQWLQHFPVDLNTMVDACTAGNMQLIRWLRSQGCPWSSDICSHAALLGDTSMLQWLRQQDPPCPWSCATLHVAAELSDLSTLAWILQQHPPDPSFCHNQRLSDACLLLLFQHGYPLTPACMSRLKELPLPWPFALLLGLLRWARKEPIILSPSPGRALLHAFAALPDELILKACVSAGMAAAQRSVIF